jgi:hypothetical protein
MPQTLPGELLCRTILLSLDPANRAWMNGPTYRSQLSAGDVMSGSTLCEVVDANGTEGPEGAIVACEAGWQECEDAPLRSVHWPGTRGGTAIVRCGTHLAACRVRNRTLGTVFSLGEVDENLADGAAVGDKP